MRVAILGAGSIAYCYAAYLAEQGHQPVLWSPSGKRARALRDGAKLVASGALEGEYLVDVADSAEEAIQGATAVIIAVPAYGYESVLAQAIPHLVSGQSVIFSAHLSFAGVYLSKELLARGVDCPIIVWNTTALSGRQPTPTSAKVAMIRRSVEVAVIPAAAGEAAIALCAALFGDRFTLKADMIGVDLGNLNPAVHYGIAMFNITRMEKAETWAQQAYMTPAVCNLLEDLDLERLSVAAALGVNARTIHQSYAVPGQVEIGPLAQMVAQIAAIRPGVNGPTDADTRYVTEDVPYGLLTTVRLAEMAGVDVPLHRAGILVFSSLYGRDFSAENKVLPQIAEAFTSAEALRRATTLGWAGLV